MARKLREARLALALEQQSTKAEILTRYLNIVYFGRGAYGVQAAAQRYFSVNAADLTLPQAAMLAGLVQQPGDDDPITNPKAALERRNQVLERMHDLGHITDQELDDDPPRCRSRWPPPHHRPTGAWSRAPGSSATSSSATSRRRSASPRNSWRTAG